MHIRCISQTTVQAQKTAQFRSLTTYRDKIRIWKQKVCLWYQMYFVYSLKCSVYVSVNQHFGMCTQLKSQMTMWNNLCVGEKEGMSDVTLCSCLFKITVRLLGGFGHNSWMLITPQVKPAASPSDSGVLEESQGLGLLKAEPAAHSWITRSRRMR